MTLGRIAEQVLAGGASCQAPTEFFVALLLFIGAFVSHAFLCLLFWQKPNRTRLDNLLLLLCISLAVFYANNLVAAFVCQQIERPMTNVAVALCLVQLCVICTEVPLIRHIVYEKVLSGDARDARWLVRNYLPAAAYFLCTLPVFWFRPDPWPTTAGYLFTAFNIPAIAYFIPGSLRAYRAYVQRPDLVSERGWRQLVRASFFMLPALIAATVAAPFIHSLQTLVALSIVLKLVLAVPSLIMIHSILRYGFLDIVLKRSLLYGVVGVELLGVYLVLAFLVRESFVGELAVAVPALHFVRTLGFAAILAGAVKPLREQCERMLDLTLFRRSTSFRGNLVQLGQHLPRTADTATLVVAVAEGLARALPVSGASVGVALERRWFTAAAGTLSAPEEAHMQALRRRLAGMGATDVTELADIELCRRLHAQGVDLVVPVGAADGNGGVILLGRKPSGAVFLGEERAFLDAFAVQVAAGLEHSQLLAAHLAMGRELAHAEQLAATGGLAARLAHEIRNPITAVKSLSQLIERDPTAPENVAHLRIVTQELDRVERRVAALLRLTRKEEYRFAAIDARELLHDVLEQFRGRLTDSGVQLAASPLPHVTVHGDAEKLRQVLGNLIQNAIEAMDGAAHRRLVIAADCADNGTLRISVADRGPGIPPEQAAHIFEPFYTTKENGTGLGLAIAKRIVDAHHGRLSVAANPEGGTIFRVELPVAVTSDE